MNGEFSQFYPVPQVGYIAPSIYKVNVPIDFAFDLTELSKVVPLDIINKTKFAWDFGDGTNGEGQKNKHAYTKTGSYILSITADTRSFEPNAEPQVLQSVLLHVIENESYVFPRTQIVINGFDGKDINSDWLEVNFHKPVIAEARVIQQGTSPIVSYEWDFVAGETGKGETVTHTYGSASTSVMILLRVKDEKGFIVDKAVGLVNNSVVTPATVSPAMTAAAPNISKGAIMAGLLILGACLYFFVRKKGKN